MDYKKRLEGVCTDNSFAFFHDGPIVRGSTQVHSFRIPNDITNIREVFVTYNQRETVYASEVIDNKITLSEADTFKFKANEETAVQLKITTETEYIVSPIFYIEVEKGLDELQKTYDDDFYTIDITVNKQSIRALPYSLEAISDTSLKCKFTFDSTWNGKQKIVYFKDEFNHLIKTSLSYNWCLIPTIILSNPGIINIGVYSDVSRSTIWSNDINVAAGLLHLPGIDSGATECESNRLERLLNGEINRATTRENEIETQLTTGLNEEIRRAKEAEETISNNLVIESNRAIEAERVLTDNLNAEISRAEEAKQLLTTNLNTEISRAKEAEKLLTDNLNAEVQRSTVKDNELTTGLNSEIERATHAESDLSSKLEAEKTERISSDNALSSRISIEITDRKNADDVLDKKVKAEETRALSAEDVLDKKIDAEISRATTAESDLNQNLTAEISRAKDAEKVLTDNLSSEVSRATMAESTLDTKITDEITNVNSINAEIASNLTKEVNRATEAENQIAINLTNEISRATTKETDIDNRLTSEISSRNTGDTNLQAQIDAINSRSDVVDVVATKAELDAYDKDISINDIVKVLQDGTHDNATSYYRNTASSKPYVWEFIGSSGPYYTQAQTDGLISNEATLRESKDNELNTKIDTEIDRAKAKEKVLQEAIDSISASSLTITVDETAELIVVN